MFGGEKNGSPILEKKILPISFLVGVFSYPFLFGENFDVSTDFSGGILITWLGNHFKVDSD